LEEKSKEETIVELAIAGETKRDLFFFGGIKVLILPKNY
jgi:hypothetical protein